jgi:hypothetical protein
MPRSAGGTRDRPSSAALPSDLRGSLPTVEEFEATLETADVED